MRTTVFLITIDTEGDNIWARRREMTTENARFLPRFQALCEEHGFKPTYLVNYEMVTDARFQAFGRAALRRGVAEIGLHVHAWDSPPRQSGNASAVDHLYIYELPKPVMFAQMETLTRLLADVFEVRPVSHRAGKWGFNEEVARQLVELGYEADCSVTPGISWRRFRGMSAGAGGPDFRDAPVRPYFVDPDDVCRSGDSSLLEVPVTVRTNYPPPLRRLYRGVEHQLAGRLIRLGAGPSHSWLRPNGRNLPTLLDVVEWGLRQDLPVLQLMLHSSELMPGGSPTFPRREQVEALYKHLGMLFAHLRARNVVGMTLDEYRQTGWVRAEEASRVERHQPA